MYGRTNMIIKNFIQCSDAVKCQLFQSFCTSFYCASLWSSYIKTLKRLKVAYNRIFRTLMGLQQRARMSENLIRRGLDPFKVIIRKLVCSYRTRIIQSNNVLGQTKLMSWSSDFPIPIIQNQNFNKKIFPMTSLKNVHV